MSADRVVQCMLAGMSERISPVSAMAFSTGPGNASYDLQDPVLTRQWIHIKDHQQTQTQHTHTHRQMNTWITYTQSPEDIQSHL